MERMQESEERAAYAVLGLPDRAPTDDVVRAYRKLARKHHPDMGGDVERWHELQQAYRSLAVFVDQDLPPDAGIAPGPIGQVHEAWRWLPRSSRMLWTIVAGLVVVPLVGWWLLSTPGVSWPAPAAVTAYLAGWWVWWIIREARTPALMRVAALALFFPNAMDGATVADTMQRPTERP